MAWSDELYRLLEHAPGHVAPTLERLFERVHADDVDRLRQAIAAGDRSAVAVDEEVRVVLPGGRQRRLAFRTQRSLNPHELHGTVQDISEQARTKDRFEVLVAEYSADAGQLRAVVELGRVAMASATAKDLIGTALTTVVETLAVEGAAFVTYRAGEGTIAVEQSIPDRPAGQVFALSGAPRIRAALQAERPVAVDAGDCDRLFGVPTAGVWATVRAGDQTYGAIVAYGDQAGIAYGDKIDIVAHQARFMASVAELCGSAIEREERDRRRSEFVATASHELRTPATSILGFLELLISGEAGQLTLDQHHMLAAI
ncbi:MAG: histidine kinase dimerization/phospho-acceptor domain-containing protein, partial [Acidimicrobiales bacterium]|nr:histidine kinase dimerization/phospho-acceptor domain-containing protein [Acidimicrobiales bacterium]